MKIYYLLGSFALVLQNYASLNLPHDFAFNVQAHLPGVTDKAPEVNPQQEIEKLIVDPSFTVSGDMIHLLYAMARKYWLEHHLFPVHSSCVGNPKTGYYLIMGENGAGKSTTSLSLIAHHGALLFSGDKTLIKIDHLGKMHAVAGTKRMTTRIDTQLGEFKNIIQEEDLVNSDRNSFQLRDAFIESKTSVTIRGIYWIRSYHTVERNEALTFPMNLFVLYPHFVDQEKADVILGLGQRLLSGEISKENKEENMKEIVNAMKKTRVRNITGSFPYVVQEIVKDIETNPSTENHEENIK